MTFVAIAATWRLLDQGSQLERWVEEQASLVRVTIGSGIAPWLMSLTMVRDMFAPFIYFKF